MIVIRVIFVHRLNCRIISEKGMPVRTALAASRASMIATPSTPTRSKVLAGTSWVPILGIRAQELRFSAGNHFDAQPR